MKNIAKSLILVTFAISSLAYFTSSALAASPTMFSTKATSTLNEATLEGSVNPNGHLTTAWFEYGTSNNLANFSETIHVNVGSSNLMTPVSTTITDLTPSTTYYFRMVTDNGQGTLRGGIFSFDTAVALNDVVGSVISPIGLEANVISSTGFLPSTLIDWLILILVVLSIVTVARLMFKGTAPIQAPKDL